METSQQQIEQLLQWFGEAEEVPLQVRHDFFQHVTKQGGLDQASFDFMAKTIEGISADYDQKLKSAESQWRSVSGALAVQADPKFSLKERVVDFASRLMTNRVTRFKDYFYDLENKKVRQEESAELIENYAKIERLKAAL